MVAICVEVNIQCLNACLEAKKSKVILADICRVNQMLCLPIYMQLHVNEHLLAYMLKHTQNKYKSWLEQEDSSNSNGHHCDYNHHGHQQQQQHHWLPPLPPLHLSSCAGVSITGENHPRVPSEQ